MFWTRLKTAELHLTFNFIWVTLFLRFPFSREFLTPIMLYYNYLTLMKMFYSYCIYTQNDPIAFYGSEFFIKTLKETFHYVRQIPH